MARIKYRERRMMFTKLDNATISDDHNSFELRWKLKQVKVIYLIQCWDKSIYFNSYCYKFKSLHVEKWI